MSRLFKAIANRRVFANRKNRARVIKAKTNDYTTLHAHLVHACDWLCGTLRGLLCAAPASSDASATAWHAERFTQSQDSWKSGMQPCVVVRRSVPVVVVA